MTTETTKPVYMMTETKRAHALSIGNLLQGNPGFVRVTGIRQVDGLVFVTGATPRGEWSRCYRSTEVVTYLPAFREEQIRKAFAMLPDDGR